MDEGLPLTSLFLMLGVSLLFALASWGRLHPRPEPKSVLLLIAVFGVFAVACWCAVALWAALLPRSGLSLLAIPLVLLAFPLACRALSPSPRPQLKSLFLSLTGLSLYSTICWVAVVCWALATGARLGTRPIVLGLAILLPVAVRASSRPPHDFLGGLFMVSAGLLLYVQACWSLIVFFARFARPTSQSTLVLLDVLLVAVASALIWSALTGRLQDFLARIGEWAVRTCREVSAQAGSLGRWLLALPIRLRRTLGHAARRAAVIILAFGRRLIGAARWVTALFRWSLGQMVRVSVGLAGLAPRLGHALVGAARSFARLLRLGLVQAGVWPARLVSRLWRWFRAAGRWPATLPPLCGRWLSHAARSIWSGIRHGGRAAVSAAAWILAAVPRLARASARSFRSVVTYLTAAVRRVAGALGRSSGWLLSALRRLVDLAARSGRSVLTGGQRALDLLAQGLLAASQWLVGLPARLARAAAAAVVMLRQVVAGLGHALLHAIKWMIGLRSSLDRGLLAAGRGLLALPSALTWASMTAARWLARLARRVGHALLAGGRRLIAFLPATRAWSLAAAHHAAAAGLGLALALADAARSGPGFLAKLSRGLRRVAVAFHALLLRVGEAVGSGLHWLYRLASFLPTAGVWLLQAPGRLRAPARRLWKRWSEARSEVVYWLGALGIMVLAVLGLPAIVTALRSVRISLETWKALASAALVTAFLFWVWRWLTGRLRALRRASVLWALIPAALLVWIWRPPPPTVLRIVAGSGYKSFEPILVEWGKQNRVDVQVSYKGSLEIASMLQTGIMKYDAIWEGDSLWTSISDKKKLVRDSRSTMCSPIVFGLKKPLAEELGWVGADVYMVDILQATESRRLRVFMTSATQSNSGASAYLGFLYAFAGNPDILTERHLQDAAVVDRLTRLLSTVDRTSDSSGTMRDLCVEDYENCDAMFNYESHILEMNLKLAELGREPFYVIYPVEGLGMADFPLSFARDEKADDAANSAKEQIFKRLQAWLATDVVQKEFAAKGRRIGPLCDQVDPAVCTPDSGCDPGRVINSSKYPSEPIIREALDLYQTRFKRPSLSVYVLDYSDSMAGPGHEQLTRAMRTVLDQQEASKYLLQGSPGDLSIVIPFDDEVMNEEQIQEWTVAGNNPGAMAALLAKIEGQPVGHYTNIYVPVARALEIIQEQGVGDRLPAVILMTDGQSNLGSLDDIKRARKATGLLRIPVYAITFGQALPEQLKAIADLTHGQVFDGTKDLAAAIRKAEMQN